MNPFQKTSCIFLPYISRVLCQSVGAHMVSCVVAEIFTQYSHIPLHLRNMNKCMWCSSIIKLHFYVPLTSKFKHIHLDRALETAAQMHHKDDC